MGNEYAGSEHFTIKVAGIAVSLNFFSSGIVKMLHHRYKNFLYDGSPDFSVNLVDEDRIEFHSPDQVRISFDLNGLTLSADTYRGSINLRDESAQLRLSKNQRESDIEYFLRVIYSLLAFQGDGLLLHAAGIVHADKAYAFMGHSGRGKSTLVRLFEGSKILSDDLVILKPALNGWRAYATPFWNPGENMPFPYQAPICGLYSLQHGRIPRISALQRSQAIAEIISNVPVITDDPLRGDKLITICDRLINHVPTYQLEFSPDKSFLRILEIDD